MAQQNFWTFNYDPRKCPCYGCKERCVGCHGKCDKYQTFVASRVKPPKKYYSESGKMRDPFHKKGRVLTNHAKKDY